MRVFVWDGCERRGRSTRRVASQSFSVTATEGRPHQERHCDVLGGLQRARFALGYDPKHEAVELLSSLKAQLRDSSGDEPVVVRSITLTGGVRRQPARSRPATTETRARVATNFKFKRGSYI